MMKTLNKFTIWLILFTWLTGNGCTKDTTCSGADFNNLTTNYHNINPIYKLNVPYVLHDTLHFTDSNMQSINFILYGIDSGYSCHEVPSLTAGCPGTKECEQYCDYNFNEIDSKATLHIRSYVSNLGVFGTLSVSINGKKFVFSHDDLFAKNGPFQFPFRIIANKMYKNVHYSFTNDFLDTLFYNQTYGIIANISQDTTSYYLR